MIGAVSGDVLQCRNLSFQGGGALGKQWSEHHIVVHPERFRLKLGLLKGDSQKKGNFLRNRTFTLCVRAQY